MKNKRKAIKKKRLPLPEDLEKRLAVYALAAGAAGMGLAATAQPAQANIFTYTPNPSLTVNTNGKFKFAGTFVSSHGASTIRSFLSISRRTANGSDALIVGNAVAGESVMVNFNGVVPFVQKLGVGATIGSTGTFNSGGNLELRSGSGNVDGNWPGNGTGYIGLDFSGKYFGWAKVSDSETASGGFNLTILEAAIDLTPNQTIEAGQTTTAVPEPGTLSLLALGAVGLFALRKKRQDAAEDESTANG